MKTASPKRRTSRRSPPKISAVEKTAVRIMRKLYEATGGQPQRWESLGNLGAFLLPTAFCCRPSLRCLKKGCQAPPHHRRPRTARPKPCNRRRLQVCRASSARASLTRCVISLEQATKSQGIVVTKEYHTAAFVVGRGRIASLRRLTRISIHAVRLVDEVGRASFESQRLAVGQGISGQEYDRQVHAVPAQLWEEVDAQDIRKAPIEDQQSGRYEVCHSFGSGLGRPPPPSPRADTSFAPASLRSWPVNTPPPRRPRHRV
jgi:hypothetical protein